MKMSNTVYAVDGSQVSLLAVIPKNGKSQAVPSSVALGPEGDLFVRRTRAARLFRCRWRALGRDWPRGS